MPGFVYGNGAFLLLGCNLRSFFQTADDTIEIDATGRRNGRGAYLCPSMDCWKKAVKSKGLERSLKMAIPKEVYEALEKEMEQFGES